MSDPYKQWLGSFQYLTKSITGCQCYLGQHMLGQLL